MSIDKQVEALRAGSQNQKILSYLSSGRSLSPLVALDRFQCLRLAARIKNLRDSGVRIHTVMGRVGKRKRVAVYSLAA
jgi:Helix-turn-helix domain